MCVFFPDLAPVCGCPDCRVCVDRELPLPLPDETRPGSGFTLARQRRIGELMVARAFAPEAVALRVACVLEAPLLGRPAFRP
ncbi:hypothetical protein [Bradyrhizobium cosmicum]|uniref:Uncharacterized protein n=1 Tax=Bradyrhizobium cosmicum TaxID=1404864 RepID=A0AAI8MBJ2_9BRAD|nr:hypothetical protein [Bradyrhizobium cosmicum]BAL77068.1 hypothetical protein S23_38730 [Bradyrhizobium cosmicum]